MAIVSSNWGPIRGKVGDMVFRQHRGHTICYMYTPPRKSYKPTRSQQLTRVLFGLMIRYATMHSRTIAKCFEKNVRLHQRDNFLRLNNKALREALTPLAEFQIDGYYPTAQQIEQAVSAYAKEHPTQIIIARLKGFEPVYLEGDWPEVVTLREKKKNPTEVRQILADGTVRIILLSPQNQHTAVNEQKACAVPTTEATSAPKTDDAPE